MRAAAITNKGGRENNEDYICHANKENMWCFILCDGLGGHDGGETASKTAAKAVCEEFKKNPRITPEAAEEYIKAASDSVKAAKWDGAPPGMATTAALLLTDGDMAVWAHIGDSRVYHITDGEISEITDDHSVAFMKFESGIITYDEIRTSADQSKLTRCIIGGAQDIPDVSDIVTLKHGDAFLICSDGFWELANERTVEKTLKSSRSPGEWLEKMLAALHKKEKEGNDNYSAFAIMV